jgi:uncharacterized protein
MSIYVDSDSHVLEPAELWQQYVPSKYRELVPQIVERGGKALIMVEERVFDFPIVAASVPGGMRDFEKALRTKWEEVPAGAKDPRARLKVLDEEGLTATVLYPTLGLLYAGVRDPQVAAVTCDAYNRWIADFCRADPRRLFAVAVLPLQDVDLAVRELKHAAELNLRGATIRPTPYNGRRLNDPAYDRFWAAAEDLGLPISIHGSYAIDTIPSVANDRYPNNDLFFSHAICHPLEQQMASMDVLCGGVVERHPRLKVSFLEAGSGWLLYWLDRLDGHYEKLGRFVPWLKEKPSEYFRRQCFVAFDADESTLKYVVDAGYGENLLWGADYPHFDCLFPGALAELREKLRGFPAEVGECLLRLNPNRFYGLGL